MPTLENSKHIVRASSVKKDKASDDLEIPTTFILKDGHSFADFLALLQHLHAHSLSVVSFSNNALRVKGAAKAYSSALNVNIHHYELHGATYHAHDDDVTVPVDIVESVLGLDTSPFKPYFHKHQNGPQPTTFTPIQVASLYGFPSGNGSGQTIGLIELGGGYLPSDLQHYFSQLGIATQATVISVPVDGATNNPMAIW